jgi:hypothetical protein
MSAERDAFADDCRRTRRHSCSEHTSTIAPIADRVDVADTDRERIKGLLYDYACKGDVGRARALAKLRKHFDLATITFPRQGIMWSWLRRAGAC